MEANRAGIRLSEPSRARFPSTRTNNQLGSAKSFGVAEERSSGDQISPSRDTARGHDGSKVPISLLSQEVQGATILPR